MSVMRLSVLAFAAAGLFAFAGASSTAEAQTKYGTIKGKFVVTGTIPKSMFIIKKGILTSTGKAPKDANVCAANDLPDDTVVIDPKGKGLGNVFVYLRRAPEDIHPSLKAVPKEKLEVDQRGCRYVPHTLFVRVGQSVLMKSMDNCSHNIHSYPLINEGQNFILRPKFRKGVPMNFEGPEPLPVKVGCDIHPWMRSYWLVLDHPYGAISVSDAKGGKQIGTFTIEKLPYGEYDFVVWHEKAGYISIDSRRGFKVKVDKPAVELKPFEVPAKDLK